MLLKAVSKKHLDCPLVVGRATLKTSPCPVDADVFQDVTSSQWPSPATFDKKVT